MTVFTKNHELRVDLAMDWILRNWSPVLGVCRDAGAPVKFVAIIIEVDFSTDGFDLNEHEFLGRYFRVDGWGPIADAEFRISRIERDRYYLNLGLSTYQTLNFAVRQDRPGVASVRVQVIDKGLKATLDANTKVNILLGRGEIEVEQADFEALVSLVGNAVDVLLPGVLRQAS